jgi:hypothetical protein
VGGVVATRHVDAYPHGDEITRERGAMSPFPDSASFGVGSPGRETRLENQASGRVGFT